MIYKYYFILSMVSLTIQNILSSQLNYSIPDSYKVDRRVDGDIVYFRNEAGCQQISAIDIDLYKCQCEVNSTFYWRKTSGTLMDLQCWYETHPECGMQTTGSAYGITHVQNSVNGWVILYHRYLEFANWTKHNYQEIYPLCNEVNVQGNVDFMDYDKWSETSLKAATIFDINSRPAGYFLKVLLRNESDYAGHLIRVTINCRVGKRNYSYKLFAKFSGQRVYRKDKPVQIPKDTTDKTTQPPQTTDNNNNNNNNNNSTTNKKKDDDDTNTGLIIGVSISIAIIVILLIILVVLCLKRRSPNRVPTEKTGENGTYQPANYVYPNVEHINPFTRATNSFLEIPTKTKESSDAPPVPRSPRPNLLHRQKDNSSTSSTAPLSDRYIEMSEYECQDQYTPIQNNEGISEYGKLQEIATADNNYQDLSTDQKPGVSNQLELYTDVNPEYQQSNVYEGLDNVQNNYMDPNTRTTFNNEAYVTLKDDTEYLRLS